MKKSKFIEKVLKSKSNTVFVNAEQVENAIKVFEKLGMFYSPVKTLSGGVKMRFVENWKNE